MTRQQTLHLLDKYTKTTPPKTTLSEGASFAQKGKKGKGGGKQQDDDYDKSYWKDKECYTCHEKGHPSSHCPNKNVNNGDERSRGSSAKSVKKLTKDMQSMKKKFSTINTQLQQLKEDESDISDSDDDDVEETSHFQFGEVGFQFAQMTPHFEQPIAKLFKQSQKRKSIELNLREIILLDSQSTMDLICNQNLVIKTFKSDDKMTLHSNGGTMTVSRKAKIAGYENDVWFSTRAITNIIALRNLIKQYRVTYDSDDLMFVVHRERHGKPNMQFRMHKSGLHYFDPRDESFTFVNLTLINTVSENKKSFTKRQIKAAEEAKSLYSKLAYPSMNDFKWIIRSHQIKNCPVLVRDIDTAWKTWGKDIAALKGKTTRTKPLPVSWDLVEVPKEILKLHKEVFLTADIFFVNRIPFFLTLSRVICFTAVNHLANRTVPHIFKAFKKIYLYYLHRGFRITTVHVDGEFEPLKPLIEAIPGGPFVNLASANEHAPEIERRVRVVKERVRATRHGLPHSRIPKLMVIYMVLNAVKILSFFPTKGGVSDTLSPKTIMSGETLDYKKHLALQIGQHCQVHEEDAPRNSQNPRTRGAIALGCSDNIQGGFKFMALNTGQKITRRSWDVIPTPDTVIERVNMLAGDQPEQLVFTDRHGRLIGDNEIPGVDSQDPVAPDDAPDDAPNPPADPHEPDEFPGDVELPGVDVEATNEDLPQNPDPPTVEIDDLDNPQPDPTPIQPEVQPEQAIPEATTTAEPTGLRRSSRIKTQTRSYEPSMTGTKYSYATAQLADGVLNPDAHMFVQDDFYRSDPDVVAAIMTQLSLKSGLREWGDRARVAAHNEMKQLHLRNTFRPKHWRELNAIQRQTVLESHMFLKEKRDEKIKGRTVAGGNKQRDFISKEDASSPTVATESVLLTCVIDAQEGRDVAVIDIPNAFIQTEIENEKDMAIIKLRGVLVDILIEIAPDVYKPYAYKDKKGIKQLLVQCCNAIYGTMTASLLFYKKFTKSLTSVGFEINPYDPCVANKMIKGKQMTICYHVDDCKLSHRKTSSTNKMIKWLRREYETIFPDGSGKMTVSRGKVHKYLGMTLDYTQPGKVKISMFDYIDEILGTFDKVAPKEKGTKSSAAPSNLFTVDEDTKDLAPNQAVEFHNLVAKTLYATKRARPDTCTAIAFLTTRVRAPNKDDWTKLVHLMKYLRGTRKLPLTLSADNTGVLKWWVDASFAVHPNMRGHSGGGFSMGRGFPIVSSTKQKLNTRSSTETEVVGADDFMPAICWTRYFMEAQGYKVNDNILFQDNKSAMLLEKNGKKSSSKRTKHINIRYFFITDRIAKGELKVEWCPTQDMIGDYMTKPLQGALFRKFRDQIMGVVPAQVPEPNKSQPLHQA